MTQNTLLAEHINTAHTKAKLDEACKKLLAHKIILAWIMQQTLNEFKDYSVQEIAEKYIEGIPVISLYLSMWRLRTNFIPVIHWSRGGFITGAE